MTDDTRSLCTSNGQCLREQLLDYLDAPPAFPCNTLHSCCGVCSSRYRCVDCSGITSLDPETEEVTASLAATNVTPVDAACKEVTERIAVFANKLKNKLKGIQELLMPDV